MAAGNYTLKIEQGATFARVFTYRIPASSNPDLTVPKDLTGWTARSMVRHLVADVNPVLSFTSSPPAGLVLGGTAGTIALTITATQTAALAITTGFWDLELVAPDGTVTRLLQGPVTVSDEVTR